MARALTLRNLPPDTLRIAQHLCERTGLSTIDVLRQAIVSGLLVEATKLAPDAEGMLGGLEAQALARALRRHLGSAIDLLVEQGEHPYQKLLAPAHSERTAASPEPTRPASPEITTTHPTFEGAIGDDLDMLGFGKGLSMDVLTGK